jgi:hypothetical protein
VNELLERLVHGGGICGQANIRISWCIATLLIQGRTVM